MGHPPRCGNSSGSGGEKISRADLGNFGNLLSDLSQKTLPNTGWRAPMRKLLIVTLLIIAASTAWAKKEKSLLTIQVIKADASVRDISVYHSATSGKATTNCDTNGNVNATTTTYGD